MNNGLTFNTLRRANLARIPLFKNAKGEPSHSHPEGRDWTPAQWLQAVTGELGEYANLRKKFERGDISEKVFTDLAGKELADIQIYLDILAFQIGIDLGQATVEKFNEVSQRISCAIRIQPDGSAYYRATN